MPRLCCRALHLTLPAALVAALLVMLPGGVELVGARPAAAKPDRGGPGGGQGGGQGAGAGKTEQGADRGGRGPPDGKGRGQGLGAREAPGRGQGAEWLVQRLTGRDHGVARARYAQALGRDGGNRAGAGRDLRVVAELTPAQTEDLLRRGWSRHEQLDAGWRNHGERVSTLVAIAKALGYPASVGALQANFGTPYETGLEPAPTGDWPVIALDVNDDGRVDRLDLAALGATVP
jgi:hypothetical protein